MQSTDLVTFDEWRHQHPEKWARVEGTITRNQLRSLKYLDAQIHLTRERESGTPAPDSIEVRWLRTCIFIYLYVVDHAAFPKDERSVMWMKNQRRASLCDYQVAALQQIPNWDWQPSRTTWDQRVRDLNDFRQKYGREPRNRSVWDYERSLGYWYTRQRVAARAGKLTPNQVAQLEGDDALPTGELVHAVPTFAGSYEIWFRDFWGGL